VEVEAEALGGGISNGTHWLLNGMGSRVKLGALENESRERMNQNVSFEMWEVGSWKGWVQVRLYVNIESCQAVQAQVKNDWWRPGSN
jgi:hypothetical protein